MVTSSIYCEQKTANAKEKTVPPLNNNAQYVVLSSLLLIAAILLLTFPAANAQTHREPTRNCFPARSWDANDDLRPCVSTQVHEDGSFSWRVEDANGTVRYSGKVRNLQG
jgi:hypothetical protein